MPPTSHDWGANFYSQPHFSHHIVDTLLSFDTTLTLLLNGSDSVWLDHFAMLCTKPIEWVALYLILIVALAKNQNRPTLWYILGGLALCVLISDQVSSSIVKPLVCRPRPTHDPAIMHLIDTVNNYRGGHYGFFSSHAANTMSVAVFLSMIIRQRLSTFVLVSWSLLNCWTRLYLGVHFAGDIVVGLVFGAVVGYCVYRLVVRLLKDQIPPFHPATSYTMLIVFIVILLFSAIFSVLM